MAKGPLVSIMWGSGGPCFWCGWGVAKERTKMIRRLGEDLLGRLTGVQLPLEETTLTKRAYFLQKPKRLPQQDVGILF